MCHDLTCLTFSTICVLGRVLYQNMTLNTNSSETNISVELTDKHLSCIGTDHIRATYNLSIERVKSEATGGSLTGASRSFDKEVSELQNICIVLPNLFISFQSAINPSNTCLARHSCTLSIWSQYTSSVLKSQWPWVPDDAVEDRRCKMKSFSSLVSILAVGG